MRKRELKRQAGGEKNEKYSGAARIFLIAVSLWLASCGGLASPDANVNLPQKQNTNSTAAPPAVSATPNISSTVETVSSATPVSGGGNISVNNNSSVNSRADANVDSSNNTPARAATGKLMIPVAGIKPESLRDTFNDARSEGRVHDAIDIMAPGGTPVLAAADGEIARFFDSERGGITIYQFSADKKMIYYYAHLQRRADGIAEHQFVRQGTVIGYVGDTGNAGTGNFHLHFAIWIIDDPKHYWDGTNINPYPLLR